MPLQGIKINCHSFVLDYVDFSFNRLTSTRRALSNDTQLHTENVKWKEKGSHSKYYRFIICFLQFKIFKIKINQQIILYIFP